MLRSQIVRYALVGVLSVSADFLVLNLAYLKFHASLFWSVFFGFSVSVFIGYCLHSRWTFQYNTEGREFSKLGQYVVMTLAALSITEGIVAVATGRFGLYYNYAKALALVVAIAFTFLMSKYWIFRRPPETLHP